MPNILTYRNVLIDPILVAAGSTNLFTYSEDFTQAYWDKQTVTTGTVQPGVGATDAYPIMETAFTNSHIVYQAPSTMTNGVQYTYSIYAKPNGRDWIWMKIWDGSVDRSVYFNVTTGVIGTITGSGITSALSYIASGFYRCSITFTAAGSGDFLFGVASADNTNSYLGDITKGIIFGGAKKEVGLLTAYVKTP